MKNKVYAIILVGGKGKRLRPLSSNARPKAFLSVTRDRKTLFKVTLGRAQRLVPAKNILVAANKAHARLVKKDFPEIGKNLLLEPVSRNTAPAIAWAAIDLKRRFGGNVIAAVLPADQYIKNEKRYINSLKRAAAFAEGKEAIVVLGIKPAFASTQFGYIKVKGKGKNKEPLAVERFTEKPDLKTAKRFIKDGNYFWNAGGFIFRVDTVLEAFRKFTPRIYNNLQTAGMTSKLYKKLPDVSIDYAVMEKADNVYCLSGEYGWEDIGSFEALKKVLKKEGREFIEKNGKVTYIKP